MSTRGQQHLAESVAVGDESEQQGHTHTLLTLAKHNSAQPRASAEG